MEKLNLEQCITIINDGFSISTEVNNHSFIIQASIVSDVSAADKQILGYTVYIGNKVEDNVFFKTQAELLIFMKENKLAIDDVVNVTSIDGKYATFEEYLKETEFQKLDMKGILNLYPQATAFSLTMPYGDFNVDEKQGDEVLQSTRRFIYHFAEGFYNRYLSDEDKEKFPSLEVIISNIKDEINFFKLATPDVCLSDMVGSNGATKYSTPLEFFFRLYQILEMEYGIKMNLESLVNCQNQAEPFKILDLKEFNTLKKNFDHLELGYIWHCSASEQLQKTFFFKMNDETKAWLLQYKTEYDFESLCDFALYDEDDLIFSSYTKGKVHFDTSK